MKQPIIQIELTPEQQAQIQQATGSRMTAVELKAETLEQRVAPGTKIN